MAFNQYMEGVITASLGTLLILFGLPYLASVPRVGKNTPKKQALLTLFKYFQFFLSCVLLGAAITVRVLIHNLDVDFNTAYIAAAIPAGALIALIGLLFFRSLMLVYGLFVGMLLGMLLEAGLDNIFDTQDEHACTTPSSPCPNHVIGRGSKSRRETRKENLTTLFSLDNNNNNRGQAHHPYRGPALRWYYRQPFAFGMVHAPGLFPCWRCSLGHEPQLLERSPLRRTFLTPTHLHYDFPRATCNNSYILRLLTPSFCYYYYYL
jgi:hypothetical protein